MSRRERSSRRRRRGVVAVLAALSLPATDAAWPVPAAAEPVPTAGAGRVELVVLGDRPLTAAEVATATGGAGTVQRTVGGIGATVVEVPAAAAPGAVAGLEALRVVDDAYRPSTARAFVTPNDPEWFRQDASRSIGLPAAWDTTTGSSSVVIAIVDSGVNADADLAGRVLPGYDFVNGDADASDDDGHGTDTALVAAAAGNDAGGAAGVCWGCRVLPVKVLDGAGQGSMSDVAAGIVWAADHGADVINLSLGGPANDPAVQQALAYAFARDIVVIASAGNDGGTLPNYPAASPGVISVGGSTLDTRTLWHWSQRGPTWVDLAAPGCNWVVDSLGPYHFCGTSSAAPVVAGLAGLLRSARPGADRNMVGTALVTSAEFAPTQGLVGYGIVNAAAAVSRIGTVSPGPMPLPPDVTPPEVALVPPAGYQKGLVPVRVLSADDQRVAAVELWIDGGRFAVVADPPGLTDVAVDTRSLSDGGHVVQAVAVDAAGHRTTGEARSMAVDNGNPLGLLVAPSWGARVSGSFVARAYVTDPSGIMGTFIIANDRVVGGFLGAGFGQATVPVTTSGPIRVVALTVDNAGNISGTNLVVVTGSVPRRRRR